MTYVQVTAKFAGGVKRTVRLHIKSDDGTFLTGFEVDKEGDHITKQGASIYHILHRKDITKRTPLKMNLHYGELEPAN